MTCEGCNACVQVNAAFYSLSANFEDLLAILDLIVQISGLNTHLTLPIQQFHSKGHHTAAFTLDVYGHVTEQMKQDSADRMEQYIKRISKP